jgi:hypothetical protein
MIRKSAAFALALGICLIAGGASASDLPIARRDKPLWRVDLKKSGFRKHWLDPKNLGGSFPTVDVDGKKVVVCFDTFQKSLEMSARTQVVSLFEARTGEQLASSRFPLPMGACSLTSSGQVLLFGAPAYDEPSVFFSWGEISKK